MICSKCFTEHNRKHRYCKSCNAIYHREYRRKNKDKINEWERNHYNEKHKSKRVLLTNEEKKKRIKEYRRKWYIRNKISCLNKSREYIINNLEKHKQYDREWSKKNKDKKNASKAKRRSKMVSIELSNEQKNEIQQIYKDAAMKSKGLHKYHVDHVIPLSKGGLHVPNNLRIILAKDNLEKGNKIPYNMQLPLMI